MEKKFYLLVHNMIATVYPKAQKARLKPEGLKKLLDETVQQVLDGSAEDAPLVSATQKAISEMMVGAYASSQKQFNGSRFQHE